MGNLSDLLSSLEGMGGAQAVQVLEGLLAQTGQGGTEAIRINLAHDEDGTIGISVGGRSFSFPALGTNPSNTVSSPGATAEYVPKPTLQRWQEEMAVVPGAAGEQMIRLVTHVINCLLPEARQKAKEEGDRVRQAEEEAAATAAKLKEEDTTSAAAIALPESRSSPLADAGPAIKEGDVEMGEC